MIIFKHSDSLMHYLDSHKNGDTTVGFVPTMGALHDGHLSLLEQSKKDTAITVCSIFINPTQFNDLKDYEKYPVSIEEDINKVESLDTDILFLPGAMELYPHGTKELEKYELGYLESVLEGKFRPGHFQGVCQVMSRFLKIIKPGRLFMGQKDYQQSLVVQKLINAIRSDTTLLVCPTRREAGGLAMSSRNVRLPKQERKKAGTIYQSLMLIKQDLQPGDLSDLKQKATALLVHEGFTIDYVEIADAHTLELASSWDGKQEIVALIAAYLKDVRLIDNMLLNS